MKSSTLFFCAIASALTINSMSPDSILNSHKLIVRAPASNKDASPAPKKFDICKYVSKGEKLETDVKKLLEDKVEVLESVKADEPKVEAKEEAKEDIKEEHKKSDDKKPKVVEQKSENSELMALMSQMTTMFTTQMQMQMMMQNQMMSMMLQMQTNMMPQINPYSPSLYLNNGPYNGYPSFSDSIGLMGLGVGIPAPQNSNPYSAMPVIQRTQLQSPVDFGFSFNNQAPEAIKGFDFNIPPEEFMKVDLDQTTVAL
jgi:hypothetical protein